MLKNFHQKIKKNMIKNTDLFHISAQNIDCGYSLEPPPRGGSNEYLQSLFLSRIRKKCLRGVYRGQNYIDMFSFNIILYRHVKVLLYKFGIL